MNNGDVITKIIERIFWKTNIKEKNMKKVLVTGATGYIGSHTCKRLKEYGYHITGWDINIHNEYNDISRYCDIFKKVNILSNDVFGEWDSVVHLAGLSLVEKSMSNPYAYYNTNINGTNNIVTNVKTDHILFAGTSSAWSMVSPYARSKVCAEDVIKEKSSGYTIFRFFNVSGTNGIYRQLGPATHLIRIAAEHAAGHRDYIEIYGTDYNTRDGTCVRDYIHVEDICDAIAKAVDTGPLNTPYECLGSSKGHTVLEVLNAMENVTGKRLNIIKSSRRGGDSEINLVDNLSNLIQPKKSLENMCYDQYIFEKQKNNWGPN